MSEKLDSTWFNNKKHQVTLVKFLEKLYNGIMYKSIKWIDLPIKVKTGINIKLLHVISV